MKLRPLILTGRIMVSAPIAGAGLLSAAATASADVIKADNTTALNLGGSWVGGALPLSTDTVAWDATVTAARSAALGGDTTWNGIKLSGAVGFQTIANASSANLLTIGAGGIDFTGAAASSGMVVQSKLLLGAAQTWNVTDSVTASGGVLNANQNEDLAFAAQVQGASVDLGGFTLTKTGVGTLFFGSGYSLTNGTISLGANAGTLVIQSGSSRDTSSAANISVGTGSTYRLQVNSNATPVTALTQSGTVTLSGGTLNLVQNTNTANSTLTLSGNISVTAASTLSVSNTITNSGGQNNPTLITGGVSGNGTLTLNNTASSTKPVLSGVISNSGGTLAITLSGGSFTFSNTNTYTGTTRINGGTLSAGTNGSFGTGILDFGGGTIASTDNTSRTFSNAVSLSSTGIFGTSTTGNLLFTGGVALGNLAGGAKTMTINNTTTEFSGVLSSTDVTGSVTKNGTGTLVLSGANTYTKKTIVSAGTLLISGSGTLGASTAALAANGGTLDLGGTSQTVGATTFGGGTVQNGTLTGASYTSTGGTVSANLGGAGSFTQSSGNTVLSGNNTYSGGTTISGGTLFVNNTSGSGTGSGLLSLAAGGILGGSGTIIPTGSNGVAVDGAIAPGTSIGNLTINLTQTTGTLSLSATGLFKFELGSAGASINNVGIGDLLTIASDAAGDVAFANNTVDFQGTGAAGWYKLLDTSFGATTWTGLTVGAGNVITGGLVVANLTSGLTGQFVMGDGVNGNVGDIYLNVVPEPGSAVALAGGAVMLLGLGRRTRRG